MDRIFPPGVINFFSQVTFLIYNRTHNLINFCQIFQQAHFHEMKCKITVTAGADKSKKFHLPTGHVKKKNYMSGRKTCLSILRKKKKRKHKKVNKN